MQVAEFMIRRLLNTAFIFVTVSLLLHMTLHPAGAFNFHEDTAHGNETYGVNRSGTGYATGNCAHCHDTFDSTICGQSPFILFATYDETLCFGCHKTPEPDQDPVQHPIIVINKSYSCNFGGNADEDTCDADILSAFSHSESGSSHWLPDIKSFAIGTSRQTAAGLSWSLDERLTPCGGCHNSHVAQRNYYVPYVAGRSAITRPSAHNNLWGDDSGETMGACVYQPPYWSGSTHYEPDNGSDPSQSKANTPDYPTFCTDCHNTYNPITSNNPQLPSDRPWGSALLQVDWSNSGDKHGAGAANGGLNLRAPYSTTIENKVLSCTDCHEPHGSKNNVFLIRTEVNDANLDDSITTFATVDWSYLCSRCHKDDSYYGGYQYKFRQIHHLDGEAPYSETMQCSSCHGMGGGGGGHWDKPAISCDHCHFHGSDDAWYPWGTPTHRQTF